MIKATKSTSVNASEKTRSRVKRASAKPATRAIAWVLAVMLSMGAVSFQPAFQTARAARDEQRAWQSILDEDLKQSVAGLTDTSYDSGDWQHQSEPWASEPIVDSRTRYESMLAEEVETFETQRYIVKLASSSDAQALDTRGGQSLEASFTARTIEAEGAARSGGHALVEFDVAMTMAESRQAIEQAANSAGLVIEYIQPDYPMQMSALQETGEAELGYATETSFAIPSGGAVIVAVLDTGIDTAHPGLIGRLFANLGELHDNSIDDDGNGYIDDTSGWDFFNGDNSVNDISTYMDQWHGTHIAGIIAQQAPNAVILPIKVFEGGTAYTSDIIEAIAYAESMGAKVINCSWGSRFDNPALREAMEGSESLFVCAAGNGLYNLDNYPVYPAAYSSELDNVISVASVDNEYKLSRFSNYGIDSVDIAAMGEDIVSFWLGGGYESVSGTSMSAAFVSAAAAEVLGVYSSCNAQETKERILESADTVTGLVDKIGGGRLLNAGYASSGQAGPHQNVIDAPDDEPLPIVVPNQPPEEEDGYELYGAENHATYRASMSVARHGLRAAAIDGKVYAIGGQTAVSSGYTNLVEKYDPYRDEWTAVQGMNSARSYFGILVHGGYIYAMGGIGSNGANLNTIERYDPVANTWTTLPLVLPVAMRAFTVTLIPGTNTAYIVGGFTSISVSSVYEYNIANGTITAKPNLTVGVSNHVAFYYDGKIYIEGGLSGGTLSQNEYKYSIATGVSSSPVSARVYNSDAGGVLTAERFMGIGGKSHSLYASDITHSLVTMDNIPGVRYYIIKTHLLTARASFGTLLLDGKVYIIGGINGYGVMPTMEMIDLGWEEKASPPVALSDYKTVSTGGKIYLMGGVEFVNSTSHRSNKVFVYDSINDAWSLMDSPMPFYGNGYSLTAAYGKIYLVGGLSSTTQNGVFTNNDKIFEYDPKFDIWTEKITMPDTRCYHYVAFYDGKIVVMGGLNSSGQYMSTADVYDPLTNTISALSNSNVSITGIYSCVIGSELFVFDSFSTNYMKYSPANGWSQHTASGYQYGSQFVVLGSTLYNLGGSGNISDRFRFSPIANAWEGFVSFNFSGITQSVTEMGNKAYIITQDAQGYSTGLVTYTPPSIAWTDGVTMPDWVYGHRATVLGNNIYIGGGYDYTFYRNAFYKYSEVSNLYTPIAPMAIARAGFGLAAANGRLYAIGGYNNTAALTNVEEYNPASDTWTAKTPLPIATADMAVATVNNLIYVFGGKNASGAAQNAVRIYNPATNIWTTGANMPTARYGAGAAVIGGKIYVAGGFLNATTATNVLQVYDPSTNTWDTSRKPLPRPVGYAGTVAMDTLYVIGGFDGYNEISVVHEYSPAIDEWLVWDGPKAVRYDFATVATDLGIYAFGGQNIDGPFSSVEFAIVSNLRNEYRHLGDDRINLTGNFSRTYTDLSYGAQGFSVEFTRTYNSSDTRASHISPGWTFGFQGKIEESGNEVVVFLPNGSACTFQKNTNGSYKALDSRGVLEKLPAGGYTLTTKDRYSYGFNASGYMTWMKDRNGNQITIAVDSAGRVTSVTDQVGRVTTIVYISNRVSTITDPVGRIITYAYDSAGRLSSVKNPNGYFTYYEYHSSGDAVGLLSTVKDNAGTIIESVVYHPRRGNAQPRVSSVTDNQGNTRSYSYDDAEGRLTVTDSDGRTTSTWYDKDIYPIRERDAEGRETLTQYELDGGINRYGEVRSHTDRNGNSTFYERDNRGNIERVVNPDGSFREYGYDLLDNLLWEKDELGKYTFHVYDAAGVNLVRIARPLNGTDIYSLGGNQSLFAITIYAYYTAGEALTMTGKTIHGLLKSITDPEGGVTSYAYDAYGYVSTVTSPMGKTTAFNYNKLGWLKSTTSPRGYTTSHYYDRSGNLLKTIYPDSGIQRLSYNHRGSLTQRVTPKQYLASADTAAAFDSEHIQSSAGAAYTQTSHGYRYSYYANGNLQTATDPLGFATSFTYDIYGNKATETKPNGAVYLYYYTDMDLLERVAFKETSSGASVDLYKYEYAILQSGKTTMTVRQYFEASTYLDTVTTFDHAGRPVRVDLPDGAYTANVYNANGTLLSSIDGRSNTSYFAYDGLNRQIGAWHPASAGQFEYSGTAYDKAGRVTVLTWSTSRVANGTVPSVGLVSLGYQYRLDGLVAQETWSDGAKIVYDYDNSGNLTDVKSYSDASNYNHVYMTYNSMDRVATRNTVVQQRDIIGYPETTASLVLTESFVYDLDGNLQTATDANGIVTTYTHDLMGRLRTTSQPGLNENNSPATLATETTYDWSGNALTCKDELNRVTFFEYDKQGYLVKTTNALGGVCLYVRDRQGRLTAEVKPEQYSASLPLSSMERTEYKYDPMGRLSRRIEVYKDSNGAWKTVVVSNVQYDGCGNVTLSQDALGYLGGYGTVYEYDMRGKLTKTIDPECQLAGLPYTSLMTYDGMGRLSSVTEANAVAGIFTYDARGNALTTTLGGVLSLTCTYDYLGNLKTSTDGNGNTSVYEFNNMNGLRSATLMGDATIPAYTVSYRYTKLGLSASSLDGMGRRITTTYNNQGRVLTVTESAANGSEAITVATRYDLAGNPRYTIDGNGNMVTVTYDALNRKQVSSISVKDVNNITRSQNTAYGYDKNGNLKTVTDWLGNVWSYNYDALGRLVERRDPLGVLIEELKYNDGNAQTWSIDAVGNATEYRYDRNGRLKLTIDGEGNSFGQQYDGAGNITVKTDGNGKSTQYRYNGQGRLYEVENALGEITTYGYDNAGNMTSHTDAAGNTMTTVYNARNLPTHRIEPGGLTSSGIDSAYSMVYTYYADGGVETQTDQNGAVTLYTYDIHGRLFSAIAGGQSMGYTYDDNGNVLTVTDSNGTTVMQYDSLNRMISRNVPGIGLSTYLLDITAGLSSGYVAQTSTDPKGNAVTRVYDKAGRLWQLKSGSDTTTYTYYPNGNRQTMAYPNGVVATYTYYADNRIHTLANSKNGSYLSTFNYAYDGNGNMTAKLEMKGETTYSYDDLGRIELVVEPDGRETSYAYDVAGNRETQTVSIDNSDTITVYAYDNRNRLVDSTETSDYWEKTTEYHYDNNGSQISMMVSTMADVGADPATLGLRLAGTSGSDDEITFEISGYDAWGRTTTVSNDHYIAEYSYGADGLRSEKTVTQDGVSVTTRYLYENGNITLELDASGNQMAHNVHGAGNIISRKIAQGIAYYLYNGRGDVVQLTDSAGSVIASYDYDAFGNLLAAPIDDANPFRYCGEYWDDETKNYYLRARYYKPSTGRFTQRDSYLGRYTDLLSLNRYTYAHNSPIKYKDPMGYSATGVNFGPNEGADWLRTGSGKSFEEFWGVGPYGSPISSGASQQSSGNNGVNFGENEGADWLRTGSGKTFEEFWGVGPYGMLVTIKETNSINNTDSTSNSPVHANLSFTRYGIQMTHSLVPSTSNYGSREVWALQEFLMDFGYFANPNTVLTGNFGPATTEALMRFQIVYLNMDAESLFDSNGLYIGCDIYTMLAINGAITMHSLYGADISYENRLRTVAYIERRTLTEGSDYVVYDKAGTVGVYKTLVTSSQLRDIFTLTQHHLAGSVTKDVVAALNYTLWKYEITSIELIQYFLGVAMHESRDALVEAGYLSYNQQMAYLMEKWYWPFYGAGYLQLSTEPNYEIFSKEMGNSRIIDIDIYGNGTGGPQYVADYYAWEASGSWWKINNMNCKIMQSQNNNMSTIDIFFAVSNATNSGSYYAAYEPEDWGDRKERFDEVIKIFPG